MKPTLPLFAALLLAPLAATASAEDGPTNIPIHFAQGRELIPGGFVAITEDGKGTIHYTPDNYKRMVHMGANFQVIYSMDLTMMNKTLNRYLREAALSQAPLMLGEWGPATDIAADIDPKKQERYTNNYQATANPLDQRGVGAIKIWTTLSATPPRLPGRP